MASVKVIQCAYAAERVELMFMGDWNQVQVEMGLKPPEELPQPKFSNEEFLIPPSIDLEAKTTGSGKANSKVKAKRKMAKQSRKQNRKKRK